ncbi:DUF397 domain-containing protein [Streptomyces albidoflavus]|uniref:DUF397 domain-containing protein n=1 Tax=Streptomyces albidoflavus TaxID=1886 RepID=UPI0033BC5769
MPHVNNASKLPVTWWKSTYSDSGAQCVECGILSPTTIAVRDSKDAHGPALLFSADALSTFVKGIAAG